MIIRRPLRQIVEDVHVDHARELFHQQREWLEARFISVLSHADPGEGQRWESAHWHDEVLWARDRQTRHLLALVCVHFEPAAIRPASDDPARHGPVRVPQGTLARRGQTPRRDPPRRSSRPQPAIRGGRRLALTTSPRRLRGGRRVTIGRGIRFLAAMDAAPREKLLSRPPGLVVIPGFWRVTRFEA